MTVRRMSRNHRTPKQVFAVAAIAAIALAACGDDDDSADSATAPAAAATTAAPATEAPAPTTAAGRGDYGTSGDATTAPAGTDAPAAGAAAVLVADTALGKVLTGSNGMTVYIFMPDNGGAPTCAADCAQAWPPLFVDAADAATAGDGVDAAMIATATHPDGGTQVTYNGWPLYYFAGDSAPGDTNGQGQGDVWYAMGADGNPIDND